MLAAVRRLADVAAPGRCDGVQLLADALKSGVPGARLTDLAAVASPERPMAAWLALPAELLFIVGHGNGLDMGLGPLSLCRRGVFIAGDQVNVFPCFHGAPCGRPGQAHMDADRIMARRVIAASCWGVYPPGGDFDPEASVGHGLLAGATAEVLLTSVRVTIFRGPDLALMYYLVNLGKSFGAVANAVNRYRLAAGLEADLMSFGDPASSIAASVVERRAVWRAGVGRLPLRGGAAGDFHVPVPADIAARGRFVIVDGEAARFVSGAFDLHGAIFLTRPRSAAGHDGAIELRIVPALLLTTEECRRMKDATAALSALLDGGRAALGPDHRELLDASAAWKALAELLAGWPLAHVPPGACVTRATLDRVFAGLNQGLTDFAQSWLRLFLSLVPARGIFHARNFWLDQAVFHSERRRARNCGYCDGIVGEASFTLRGPSALLRTLSHCQTCGPICDGDPVIGAMLAGPRTADAGTTVRFHVPVNNVYGCPLPVAVALVIERYDRKQSVQGECVSITLDPHERATVAMSIAIPADWPSGVCYAGAAIVFAGEINYLKRGIGVRRAAPETTVVAIHRPGPYSQS